MIHRTSTLSRQAAQRGTAVLELAIAFPILFAVFWVGVCYIAPLLTLEAMHRACAEGIRVGAMNITPIQRQTQALLATQNAMQGSLPASWLGGSYTNSNLIYTVTCQNTTGSMSAAGPCELLVTIRLSNYPSIAPLRPITLPFVGQFPNLPQNLTASAQILLQ